MDVLWYSHYSPILSRISEKKNASILALTNLFVYPEFQKKSIKLLLRKPVSPRVDTSVFVFRQSSNVPLKSIQMGGLSSRLHLDQLVSDLYCVFLKKENSLTVITLSMMLLCLLTRSIFVFLLRWELHNSFLPKWSAHFAWNALRLLAQMLPKIQSTSF